ncbi:Nif3-like dinuclear metal center hexameric protein [Lunatibacter salilacus]|uniref:Nif3-like dinuclear metal center hexameric protein n=1 Tax=Lunatibacter salilacus TaxID=2483804 RepID=UPI00131E8AAC|nr:Nif3-like dinuclear metal center hexameric protein [Lunatibacter salilacus]
MVYLLRDVISYLESVAPPSYQESYDNAQLLVGNPEDEITGILCTLDVTEEVVAEAVDRGCNLIVAHHPIIFKGLKSLTGKNYVERTVIKAIRAEVAIYAIHTNLDHVIHGVNAKIAEKIGLKNLQILSPKKDVLTKLVTFVPQSDTEKILNSLFEAGAGIIGDYKNCSFRVAGRGTFLPMENANPAVGEVGKLEEELENRIEVMFPTHLQKKIVTALKQSHPYEEVAYYLHQIANENQEVGAGMVGELEVEMEEKDFFVYLKQQMNLQVVKHTHFLDKPIKKVALCGGAGIFLLGNAKRAGADVFITSDVKYHEFFDADKHLILADIGHYESEFFTKELLKNILSQKFSNIALYLSNVVTNPISYL